MTFKMVFWIGFRCVYMVCVAELISNPIGCE